MRGEVPSDVTACTFQWSISASPVPEEKQAVHVVDHVPAVTSTSSATDADVSVGVAPVAVTARHMSTAVVHTVGITSHYSL